MSKILFFDGVCIMCNGLVDFILKHDKQEIIKFAPLQGPTAHQKIPDLTDLSSIVFLDDQKIYTKSDAVINLLFKLGGIFKALALFCRVFPQAFRDWVYDHIAQNRYRLFGKKEQCRLPSAGERRRFLD